MGITLTQIASNTATVTIQIELQAEDGTKSQAPVNITYFPGRVTEKAIAQLQGFGNMTSSTIVNGLEAFNVTLAHLIKAWDVFEDDAQTVPFPLDPARLADLPLGFRIQVISAIMGDIRPETAAPQTAS